MMMRDYVTKNQSILIMNEPDDEDLFLIQIIKK